MTSVLKPPVPTPLPKWEQLIDDMFSEVDGRVSDLDNFREQLRNDGRIRPGDDAIVDAIHNEFWAQYNAWANRKAWFSGPITEKDYLVYKGVLDDLQRRIKDFYHRVHSRGPYQNIPSSIGAASGGTLLPNGTRIGGGVHTGPGGMGGVGGIGGAPSLPGYSGGLLGSLGGNRSGRGPGGSQFMPGLGFFPGAGPGPGGVGHGVGGIGLGGDEPPGPWNGGGLSPSKHSSGGTGRQPGSGGGTKKGSGSGYSETGSKGGSDRVTGSDVDRDKVGGGGGGTNPGAEKSPSQGHAHEQAEKNDVGPGEHVDPNNVAPTSSGGEIVRTITKEGRVKERLVPYGGGGERPSDDGGGGGSDEGPRVHKGGPHFTPHGGSTGGVGVIVAGGYGPRVPGSPVSYLDFLYKDVGPEENGWGGNNPVVTPAIKPSDLFKPADDSIGPYNPKGTDYRPAPDDPSPGGPAGAAGRATRVRVG